MEELKQVNLKRQKADGKEIESLRKEKEEQAELLSNMRMENYKMGDVAKRDLKKANEELLEMKIENNSWKIEAKQRSSTISRLEKKISTLERENIDLKDKLIDNQSEETPNDSGEQDRMNQ